MRNYYFPTRVRKARFSYSRLPAINSILYSHGKRVLQLLHNFSGKWNKGFTVPAGYKNSIIPRWTPLYHDELYYTTVWKLEWHSFFALLVAKSNIRTSEIWVSFFISLVRSLWHLRLRLWYDKDLTREIKKPALIPLVRNYYLFPSPPVGGWWDHLPVV